MLKIYFYTLRVTWNLYGFSKNLFVWLIAEPLLRGFTFLTLYLDKMFFPQYRYIEVKKPIFILGHPRSGTTFLHKVLGFSKQAVFFKAWHLTIPALTGRFLIRPLINHLRKKGLTEVLPKETGHKVDLDDPEEEEMLLINIYDTQFVSAALLGFDDRDYPKMQWNDQQPDKVRFRATNFLKACFQRQILATGKRQIIAQTHFSTHRIKTLMEAFPDAKFIYVVRNPHQVIPSFFSLLHKSIDFRWGLDPISKEVVERYNKRRYQAMIDLYRYFYDLQKNGELPEDRVMVLQYDQLLTNFEGAANSLIEFTGIEDGGEMRKKLSAQAEKQKNFKPEHNTLPLEEFGITREQIDSDFDFVFERYGLTKWQQ